MADLWPGWTATTILFVLFFIAQYENQRWVRARVAGLRGANKGIGLAVDLSGGVALPFSIIWPFAYAFDAGWRHAAGLYLVGWGIMLAYGFVSSGIVAITKRALMDEIALRLDRTEADWPVLWMLGTAALWPLIRSSPAGNEA
jgi:hypothetical protein